MSNKIYPTEDDASHLREAVVKAPFADWSKTNLSPAFSKHATTTMFYAASCTLAGRIAGDYLTQGYAHLGLEDVFRDFSDLQRKKGLSIIMHGVGQPFGIYTDIGFWQTLGVNYDAKLGRAQSIGYIPLHMDFDQVTQPPDGVALFARRADPHGHGANTIYNYRTFLSRIDPNVRQRLEETTYSYEPLYNVQGIGTPLNPHPFLTYGTSGQPLLRYNGKAAINQLNSADAQELFHVLEPEFRRDANVVHMETDDLLLINQWECLHGRRGLQRKPTAPRPSPNDDRLVWQTYLRHRKR